MEPSPHGVEDWGVSMAVLTDLGYGDLVDTSLAVTRAQGPVLDLTVRSETILSTTEVSDVVLRIPLPDGVRAEPSAANQASCTTVDDALECAMARFATNSEQLLSFTFSGPAGVYTDILDIEHRAAHVDEDPFNNFVQAAYTLGSNPIADLWLSEIGTDGVRSPFQVEEGELADMALADIVVDSADPEVTYEFSLVEGSGDTDNDRFEISDGQLISRGELDFETDSMLSVRVRATASNGFEAERALGISVVDTADDGCLDRRVVQTGPGGPVLFVASAWADARQPAPGFVHHASVGLSALLMVLLALAAVRARGASRAALLALCASALFLAGCGGGGGGSAANSAPVVQGC